MAWLPSRQGAVPLGCAMEEDDPTEGQGGWQVVCMLEQAVALWPRGSGKSKCLKCESLGSDPSEMQRRGHGFSGMAPWGLPPQADIEMPACPYASLSCQPAPTPACPFGRHVIAASLVC